MSVCVQNVEKNLMKFFGKMGHNPKKNRLDIVDDLQVCSQEFATGVTKEGSGGQGPGAKLETHAEYSSEQKT